MRYLVKQSIWVEGRNRLPGEFVEVDAEVFAQAPQCLEPDPIPEAKKPLPLTKKASS